MEWIIAASVDFWQGASLNDLATQQGVAAPGPNDEVGGGWPEDELDDGFEIEVVRWRRRELEQP